MRSRCPHCGEYLSELKQAGTNPKFICSDGCECVFIKDVLGGLIPGAASCPQCNKATFQVIEATKDGNKGELFVHACGYTAQARKGVHGGHFFLNDSETLGFKDFVPRKLP